SCSLSKRSRASTAALACEDCLVRRPVRFKILIVSCTNRMATKGFFMKGYNVVGYTIILAYALACIYFAPPHIGLWTGLLIGAAYFVICWVIGGLSLSSVIHMGIAHRALDYKEWFVKTITVVNNTFGVFINPVTWVNRHRLHHKFSDHPGDPNKLSSDGFWRTLYLCLMPYKCE